MLKDLDHPLQTKVLKQDFHWYASEGERPEVKFPEVKMKLRTAERIAVLEEQEELRRLDYSPSFVRVTARDLVHGIEPDYRLEYHYSQDPVAINQCIQSLREEYRKHKNKSKPDKQRRLEIHSEIEELKQFRNELSSRYNRRYHKQKKYGEPTI